MEKNLNLRKLFLMYLRNLWIIILTGIIFVGIAFITKKEDKNATKKVSETVTMAFEIPNGMDEGTYSRRTVYFDNYRGLIAGNAVTDSDVFTKSEKEIFKNVTTEEDNGTFAVTVSVPAAMSDQAALELMAKYISESEKWMREGIDDPTFRLNVLKRDVEDYQTGGFVKYAAIFFIIGCFIAVIVMFFVFVIETVIHDADDLQYYIGVSPAFEIGKKNSFAIDEISSWLISSGKKTVMFFGNESAEEMSGNVEKTASILEKYGIKTAVYKINSADDIISGKTADKLTEDKNNKDMVLLEAPPLSKSPAALHLSPLCDLKVLYADADRENGVRLKKKLKSLSAFNIIVDGAVLNSGTKNRIFRL